MGDTILLLSSVDGGPLQSLADALREAGHDVELVSEVGIDQWRDLARQGRVGRLGARLRAFARFPLRAVAAARRGRGPVVVTTNPFVLPWALVLARRLHRRPVVALVYDLYPDVIGRPGPLHRVLGWLNRRLTSRADAQVFIGEALARRAATRLGPHPRTAVVTTGADVDAIRSLGAPDGAPEQDIDRWLDGRVVISYVGNLGHAHDWQTFAEALPGLVDARAADGRPVGILLAGWGRGYTRLAKRLEALPPGAIRVIQPTSDAAWARALCRSDVALVSLAPHAAGASVPSKAFSAMAAGAALGVVAPPDSEVASLVHRHGCGVLAAPGDSAGFARELRALLSEPGRLETTRAASLQAARDHYDIPGLVPAWEALFDRLVHEAPEPHPGYDALKRGLDLAAAGAGLAVAAPVLVGAALAIRLTMGSPVFFRHTRPGLGGRPFELLKFRTMRNLRPGEEMLATDAQRITRLGRFLRETSLDELPTLLNVLRGDMSLVGPRPLLMRYLDRYSPEQARRMAVKPGVTGWAQVNGRNATTWQERFANDVHYVDHRSLLMDLKILLQTALTVVRREGISAEGHATMPEFLGDTPEGAR